MVGPEPNGEVIPSDDFGRLLGRYSCNKFNKSINSNKFK